MQRTKKIFAAAIAALALCWAGHAVALKAVVQSAFQNQSFTPPTATFPSPPTAGNLIVVVTYLNFVTWPLDTTKWTLWNTSPDDSALHVVYRYAQAGDSATLPPINGDTSDTNMRVLAVEISGANGTALGDFAAVFTHQTTGAPILGPTTIQNNELMLVTSMQGSGFGSYTPPPGWTNLIAEGGGSSTMDWQLYATAGTSVSASPSWQIGGTAAKWLVFGLCSTAPCSAAPPSNLFLHHGFPP